jgi:hypothetical protein
MRNLENPCRRGAAVVHCARCTPDAQKRLLQHIFRLRGIVAQLIPEIPP